MTLLECGSVTSQPEQLGSRLRTPQVDNLTTAQFHRSATARQGGHADIIYESLDSATPYPLMAAAEQWFEP